MLEVMRALFGYEGFRDGQLWAIKRGKAPSKPITSQGNHAPTS
jgi:hypothetical protein